MEITITIDASERLMAALQTLMGAQASAHTETPRQPSAAPAPAIVIPTAQNTAATGTVSIAAQPAADEAPVVTLEELRAAVAQRTKVGKSEEIKAIFNRVGAKNSTQVAESDRAAVLAEINAIPVE